MKEYNNVRELNEDIKNGKIKENEIIVVDEIIPSKKQIKSLKTIASLAPLCFNLAIASIGINIVTDSLGKLFGKEEKDKIRNLKRRGIAVVEIVNKKLEETYHPLEGIEKQLNNFVKRNNKWKWEKEIYSSVKTGKYILTRIYRKYYKKIEDEERERDKCPECGRSYEE